MLLLIVSTPNKGIKNNNRKMHSDNQRNNVMNYD